MKIHSGVFKVKFCVDSVDYVLIMSSMGDNIVFHEGPINLGPSPIYRLQFFVSIVELRQKSVFRKCNNGKYMCNFVIGL